MHVDIKTVKTWSMSAQVADKFQVCCYSLYLHQDMPVAAQTSPPRKYHGLLTELMQLTIC